MIAIDTNLLVYAHRPEMPFHGRARQVIADAVGGPEPVAVPWPCVHEFLAVISNPRIFTDPTPMDLALDAVGRLLNSLRGGFLAEGEGYLDALKPFLLTSLAGCSRRRAWVTRAMSFEPPIALCGRAFPTSNW